MCTRRMFLLSEAVRAVWHPNEEKQIECPGRQNGRRLQQGRPFWQGLAGINGQSYPCHLGESLVFGDYQPSTNPAPPAGLKRHFPSLGFGNLPGNCQT